MNAAIISLGSVSSEWTTKSMEKYFDDVDALNLKKIEVRLGAEGGVLYSGRPLETYDCVYVKGSFRFANLQRAVSALLWGKCYLPIQPNAFTIVHHKLLTHLELQRQGIPMPRTYMTSTTQTAKHLLKEISFPIVMKFPEGTQGKGVMFADTILAGRVSI